jgi:hypothetical protein
MRKHGVLKRGYFDSNGWPRGWVIGCDVDDGKPEDEAILHLESDGTVLVRGEFNQELTNERKAAMGLA